MARDIYAEPEDIDLDTLRNLGPLTPLAGTWEGQGVDTHPVAEGTEDEPFLERVVFEPIDPQPNGPQLLYGLRYHIHVNKLDEPLTFHDQIGYWLWEPATTTLIQTLTIPRGQVALAMGSAAPDARRFTVKATLGSPVAGIVSAPFLHENFRTVEYSIMERIPDAGHGERRRDGAIRAGHGPSDLGPPGALPPRRQERAPPGRRAAPEPRVQRVGDVTAPASLRPLTG